MPLSRNTPLIVLAIGIVAVSTGSIFIRYAQADGAPSLVIAAARLTLATLILAPVILARHRLELAQLTKRQWLLVSASGVLLAIHFATWISSLAFTSVASSVVLVDTAPIFVALLAVWFLKEHLQRALLIGIGVAIVGSVIVAAGQVCRADTGCPPLAEFFLGKAMWGNFLAVLGAISVSGYLILGRMARSTMSLPVYIFLTYGAAAVSLLLVVTVAGLPFVGYAPSTYLWFLLLAIFPQLIGHTSFNWALKYLPATFVSVATLGEPIGTTFLAMLLLGEFPSSLEVVGGLLILVGIAVAAQKPAPPPPAPAHSKS